VLLYVSCLWCWSGTRRFQGRRAPWQDWRLELDWEEILGFVGGSLITVAFIPQVWRLYRLKSAREISLLFNILFLMGGMCWLAYGISKELLSVIVSNAVNLALVLAMLYAKVKYGRQP
jgi:MtN3 and saliva related transmembrane protein